MMYSPIFVRSLAKQTSVLFKIVIKHAEVNLLIILSSEQIILLKNLAYISVYRNQQKI